MTRAGWLVQGQEGGPRGLETRRRRRFDDQPSAHGNEARGAETGGAASLRPPTASQDPADRTAQDPEKAVGRADATAKQEPGEQLAADDQKAVTVKAAASEEQPPDSTAAAQRGQQRPSSPPAAAIESELMHSLPLGLSQLASLVGALRRNVD